MVSLSVRVHADCAGAAIEMGRLVSGSLLRTDLALAQPLMLLQHCGNTGLEFQKFQEHGT